MIFLNSTSETLEITTSSVAAIDYNVNYVDVIPTTSATPGSQQGAITSIGSTVITSAPAASTSRQIKSIFIRNKSTSVANTVSINKDVSTTEYLLTGDVILQPGATFTYESGIGWSLGTILANTLTDDIHTSYQDWNSITDPSAPSSDVLRVYSKKVSGRMLPKWKGPSGIDTPFQSAFFGNNIVLWQPAATSGYMLGSVMSVISAGVATLPTITNKYTSLRRSVFTSATGANLMNSVRSDAMFFRGSNAGVGGFFFFCRFGLNVYTAGNRLFVGVAADTTALLTADPSTKLNLLGFGFDGADSAISFIHNDGAGTATKDTISGQPALASANCYDAYIYCKPNDTTVYYRLDDVTAGTTIVDTSTSTDLPVNTTMMNCVAGIGSGANTGAGVASIGVNRIYVESDY